MKDCQADRRAQDGARDACSPFGEGPLDLCFPSGSLLGVGVTPAADLDAEWP